VTLIRGATRVCAQTLRSHPLVTPVLALPVALAVPALAHAAGWSAAALGELAGSIGPGGIHFDQRLMLTPAQWSADQRGPAMDQMFPPNGFAMHLPILVWWGLLELLGLVAFPFTFLTLAGLPDRGFVVAKTFGLVFSVYLVWIAVSLGVATYDRGFIWLVVLALALISAGMALRMRAPLAAFFRQEWKRVVAGELVFLAGFAIFIALRMWYPDLGHQFSPVSPTDVGSGRMGEKQMEMAFLNAILRSRVFPPLDPFFAHGYINYYYFGFVMVATLCKLSEIMPATAFNLAIATFFAMLLGNSYSVVLALTRRITPGVIAAVLVGLIGNLNGAWQVIQDLMQVAAVHSSIFFFGGLADVLSGLRQVLFGHQVLAPFDFWGPTRIIPPPGYPIDEFPYFTYLFADLHPHLMAFPLTVAALALAVSLLLGSSGGIARIVVALGLGSVLLGAILATNPWDFPTYLGVVMLGALVGDYATRRRLRPSILLRPLAWGVGLGALAVVLYLPFELSYRTVFSTGIGLVRDIPATAFQGLCNGNPSGCSQAIHEAFVTPLRIYLEHFAIFAFITLSYLIVLLGTRAGGFARWRRWWLAVQFAFYYREHIRRLPHAARVARRMRARKEPVADVSLLLGAILVVGGLVVLQYFLLAFLVGLVGLIILLFARLGRSLPETQLFILALFLVPIGLSIGTQFFYVKDFLDQSGFFRMNTIFKFYNQAWVLYALGSAAGLYYLFAEMTPAWKAASEPAAVAQPAPEPVLVGAERDAPAVPVLEPAVPPVSALDPVPERPPRGWSRVARFAEAHTLWSTALVLLFGGCLIYTYAGTVARETYRETWLPESSVPLTLDGMAFMKVAYPGDYAGIRWLNAHVPGAPVIAEAYSPAGYSWPSRVSMFTGLPDIFNGIHEQTEQRYGDEVDPSSLCSSALHPTTCFAEVHSRQDDLTTLYSSSNPAEKWRVIRTYGVKYIYVGWSETHCQQADNKPVLCYSPTGIATFKRMVGRGLQVAYRGVGTTIYRVTRYG
jgi:YYY domain-containing protein